jgi:hypothetical protein
VLISPVPGVPHTALRSALVDLRHALTNSQQLGPSWAVERAHRYLEWMHEARRRLRGQIRPAGLDYLLPTQSYGLVLSAASAHQATIISLYRGTGGERRRARAAPRRGAGAQGPGRRAGR